MNAIVPLTQESSIESVKLLASIVKALKDQVFVEGADFGVIPGTGDKPVLLLPGMEKLLRALRLRPEYTPRQQIVDFDKPLFFLQYECRLVEVDSGLCVSTAIGSANSHESKWRWRNAERVCPKCEAAAIKRSKFAPKNDPQGEPGWYCFDKLGGCGAQFKANDPAIVDQQVGRVENPDLADQLNTIDKIAQKRALSSAIKGAANVSELFTVDLEDNAPQIAAALTTAQARKLADKWAKSDNLTSADLKTALGGSYTEWRGGYDPADAKIAEWVNARKAQAAKSEDVIDGEFTEVAPEEMPL